MKELNDRENDVGKEDGARMQTLEAFGNGFDNKIAGVDLY